MISEKLIAVTKKYEEMLNGLENVITISEKRVLSGEDTFFINNINFFIKAYLINICTYMESMLQETAVIISKDIHFRLQQANIPINYLHWQLPNSKYKESDLKFENANFCPLPKEINDKLSANPYKTLKLFELLGIELSACKYFNDNKDIITTVVNKRNNIIHHNDEALDISFKDLKEYINLFKNYSQEIISYINGFYLKDPLY